jgi:hypothetical protein
MNGTKLEQPVELGIEQVGCQAGPFKANVDPCSVESQS